VSSQYAYGLTGSIQIDGPASLPYDIDLGPFPISDWYYDSADQILDRVFNAANPAVPGLPGASPPSDNLFFNGTNINPRGPGGQYAKVNIVPGKRHRLRLVNPSVDNTFTVSIVGHQMTVIQTDFVPVQAYTTDFLFMGVGQRYDVIIEATKEPKTYWINATFSSPVCGVSLNAFPAAILHYEGSPDNLPTDVGVKPRDTHCADNLEFVPIIPREAPLEAFTPEQNNLQVSEVINTTINRVFWTVNNTAINVDWEKPTLEYLLERNESFSREQNIVKIPSTAKVRISLPFPDPTSLIIVQWSFWLIQNRSPIPHPMHLHVGRE
jgi:FtsP/CotA-like multicopper oxidase with cupredoxin domain